MQMEDSSSGSISHAIAALGDHDEEAIGILWRRFFQRLGRYARRKIFQRHRRHYDEDDIANSTFLALVNGIKHDRFENVKNRDDLWQMLTIIASRKISNATKFFDRKKRGGGKVRGESAFGDSGIQSIAELIQHDCSDSQHDYLERICDEALLGITNERTRKVVMLRLQGYSIEEIAEEIGVCSRTIDREMVVIREAWKAYAEDEV